MQLSPLLPIAASTAIPLAQRVTQRLADGLSFAQTLAQRVSGSKADEEASNGGEVETASPGGPAALVTSLVHAYRLAQQRLEEFLVEFRALATQHDIDPSRPIELKSDGRGSVIVANNHPDRAAIERHFQSDPALAATFNQLAAAQTTAAQLQDEQRLRGEFRLVVEQNQAQAHFE